MPGAGSASGRYEAKRAAGTERVTASLIYLPRIKQTRTPALNGDCAVSQDDGGQPCLWNCLPWALTGTAVCHGSRKTAWQFLKRLNLELAHDPAVPLLGLRPRELWVFFHTDS